MTDFLAAVAKAAKMQAPDDPGVVANYENDSKKGNSMMGELMTKKNK